MAVGDAAAAAGLAVLNPTTAKVIDGATEINATRDMIANRTSTVQPVAKGGTGATDAAGARTNLAAAAAADLDTVEATIANAAAGSVLGGRLAKWGTDGRMTMLEPTVPSHPATKNYADTKRGEGDGNFGNIPLYSQNVRGYTVSTDYASVYINGAGGGYRLGITPSARRLKQDEVPHPYTLEQACAIQIVAYRLIAAVEADPDAGGEVGVIADDLVAVGLSEFVLFDESGDPASVAYERLWLVALGGLQDAAARLARLELRVDALTTTEGNPA